MRMSARLLLSTDVDHRIQHVLNILIVLYQLSILTDEH